MRARNSYQTDPSPSHVLARPGASRLQRQGFSRGRRVCVASRGEVFQRAGTTCESPARIIPKAKPRASSGRRCQQSAPEATVCARSLRASSAGRRRGRKVAEPLYPRGGRRHRRRPARAARVGSVAQRGDRDNRETASTPQNKHENDEGAQRPPRNSLPEALWRTVVRARRSVGRHDLPVDEPHHWQFVKLF